MGTKSWTRNSAVECFVHIEEVRGPNPLGSTQKMKILFLTRRFYPEIGGVEKHVLEISKILVSQGHDVSVISENYHSDDQSDKHDIGSLQPVKSVRSPFFVYNKIKVYRFNFGSDNFLKKFKIWAILLRNYRLMRDSDVVHCHDVFFWYLPFRFLFPGKKVFTTFHGYEGYPIKKKAKVVRKISEILSRGTICVGSFMKKWYKANPDYVIYGGVDIRRARSVVSNVKTNKNPTALFIGRLDEQTNILEYCRIAQKLRIAIPGFRMEIAGDGKYGSFAKKYGKLLGFVNNPEKLLPNYGVAFVSRYLSILEALAAKRPVFAFYDNPLKEDYLKMTPFKNFINVSGNITELALLVQDYYSNKKNAQDRVKKAYVWAQTQGWNNIVNIYLKLWSK